MTEIELRKIEIAISVVAVAISSLALIFSAQGYRAAVQGIEIAEKTRKDTENHNKLSLRPILKFTHHLNDGSDKGFHLSIANFGLGPAIITSVNIVSAAGTSDGELTSLRLITPENLQVATKSLSVEQVLRPNEAYKLFDSRVNCGLRSAKIEKGFFPKAFGRS